MNNRSLIGRFKQALKWVAIKSGKTCIEYDEKGTTRTCHCCDYVHTKAFVHPFENGNVLIAGPNIYATKMPQKMV